MSKPAYRKIDSLMTEGIRVHFEGKEPKNGWPKKWEEMSLEEKVEELHRELNGKVGFQDLSESENSR